MDRPRWKSAIEFVFFVVAGCYYLWLVNEEPDWNVMAIAYYAFAILLFYKAFGRWRDI